MQFWKKVKYFYQLTTLRSSQGHASTLRQLFEMAVLLVLRGVWPHIYHSAQLWKRDHSWGYKLGWLNEKKYKKRVSEYNPILYQKLSQNKLSEKALLAMFNVPSSKFLGWLHPQHGRDCFGKPLRSASDITRFLQENNVDKFCIKALEGWGGSQFQAVACSRGVKGTYISPIFSEKGTSIDQFFATVACSPDGLLLEGYIAQHPVMMALNESSVNTIRMFVACSLQPLDKTPSVVGAFVRIGRVGSLVDNTTSGGLAAVVNLESGRLGKAQYKLPHPEVFSKHPDHGKDIEGVVVPFWGEAKELVTATLCLFPRMKYGGFDVAITETGPVVVELNVQPNKAGLARIGVPTNYLLPPIKHNKSSKLNLRGF